MRVVVKGVQAGLVPWYREHMAEKLAAAQSALDEGRFKDLWTIAHGLKGSGGAYGFARISELGLLLEEEAGAENEAGCRTRLTELQDFWNTVEIVIEK